MTRSIICLALLSVSVISNAALVVNGDFESNTVSGSYSTYTVASQGVVGWTVVGPNNSASVAVLKNGYLGQSTQQLDLSGVSDGVGSGIEQTISTVAGQQYELTFDAFTGGKRYAGSYVAKIDGVTVLSGVVGDESTQAGGVLAYSYSFVATGATTKLGFLTSGGNVSHIDNVSVEAVPEPATMAVLGLGAVAMLRRRKKA